MSSEINSDAEDSADNADPDHEDADHVIGANPVDVETVSGATGDELEAMIRQCYRTLDLIEHKLSGSGRIRDVEKERVKASYIRCEVKVLKLLQDLYEKRELRQLDRRMKVLEDRGEKARQGDVRVEELVEDE